MRDLPTTYRLIPTTAEDVAHVTDLREFASDPECETYRLESDQTEALGWMVADPCTRRAGIAWGGPTVWTDCDGPEDAVERFLGLNGKEVSG